MAGGEGRDGLLGTGGRGVGTLDHIYIYIYIYMCVCVRVCLGYGYELRGDTMIEIVICMLMCVYINIYIYIKGISSGFTRQSSEIATGKNTEIAITL